MMQLLCVMALLLSTSLLSSAAADLVSVDPVITGALCHYEMCQRLNPRTFHCSSTEAPLIDPFEFPTCELQPPAAAAFYEFQNSGQCKDWVSLFSPSFSVVDPLGTPAVTSAADLLTGCTQTPQTFKVVSIKIMQAYSPSMFEDHALFAFC